jgi:hypothetical protein
MVIESLEHLGRSEPGFFTVLSIEALHEILEQHGLTPKSQMPPTPEESIEMARAELAAREAARAGAKGRIGERGSGRGRETVTRPASPGGGALAELL